MKKKFTLFVCIFLFSFFQAQQYEVDTNYGNQGMALHQLKGDKQFATDYVQLHNGKILISGTTGVIRINEDYTQDFSFGKNGRIRIPLDRIFERADHKIIGIKKSTNPNLLTIHCFLADGSYDTSFGNQGILSVSNDYNFSKEIDANYIGASMQGNQLILALNGGKFVRITSEGEIDQSFGNNGAINIPLPQEVKRPSDNVVVYRTIEDILVLPDGKIIIGATVSGYDNLNQAASYLIKYTSEGILDTNFGEGSQGISVIKYVRVTPGSNINAHLQKIKICKDGSILGLNEFDDGLTFPSMIFTKTSSDGKLKYIDTIFNPNANGSTGSLTEPEIGSVYMNYNRVLELSGGGFLISASSLGGIKLNFPNQVMYKGALSLLKSDGTVDTDFGNQGKINLTNFQETLSESNVIGTIQLKDGNILAIGGYNGEETYGLTLYKFDQRGNPILTFGKGGKMIYPIPSEKQSIFTMGVQPDNKLLLGSSTIWRLLENGSFDSGFNPIKNEYSPLSLGQNIFYSNGFLKINSMDGSIKTVGTYINSYTNNGLLLNSTPSMDRGSNHSDVLAIQADGKYIFIRKKYFPSAVGLLVAEQNIYRNNPDGTLDNTFTFDKDFLINAQDENQIQSIALQGDQLLVEGKFFSDGSLNSMLIPDYIRRFNSNGSIDQTFTPFKGGPIKVQSDHKILSKSMTQLERYLPDGDPDLSYGTHGKVDLNSILEISTFTYQILSDDKVLIHAKTTQGENQLLQLTPEGKLDINFANQGIYIIDPSLDAQIVQVQPDGKILIGGTKTQDGEEYMAVLRLKKQENQQQTKKNQSI
ncbi:hypothetical protein ETU10_08310, partial [Apibacter muscae]|uniref:hypothetical protein n=1 Tax=Apibacter muscae TaxID=2509004 RepID=UPI0011AD1741